MKSCPTPSSSQSGAQSWPSAAALAVARGEPPRGEPPGAPSAKQPERSVKPTQHSRAQAKFYNSWHKYLLTKSLRKGLHLRGEAPGVSHQCPSLVQLATGGVTGPGQVTRLKQRSLARGVRQFVKGSSKIAGVACVAAFLRTTPRSSAFPDVKFYWTVLKAAYLGSGLALSAGCVYCVTIAKTSFGAQASCWKTVTCCGGSA